MKFSRLSSYFQRFAEDEKITKIQQEHHEKAKSKLEEAKELLQNAADILDEELKKSKEEETKPKSESKPQNEMKVESKFRPNLRVF